MPSLHHRTLRGASRPAIQFSQTPETKANPAPRAAATIFRASRLARLAGRRIIDRGAPLGHPAECRVPTALPVFPAFTSLPHQESTSMAQSQQPSSISANHRGHGDRLLGGRRHPGQGEPLAQRADCHGLDRRGRQGGQRLCPTQQTSATWWRFATWTTSDPQRRRQALAEGEEVRRLPQDAGRDGEEHRRGDRQHARPLARPGRGPGHADEEARLRAEAADAQHLRGPAPGGPGPPEQSGHADGQPGDGDVDVAQVGGPLACRGGGQAARKSTCGAIGPFGRRAARGPRKSRRRQT